ncbi:MAG TPA: trypsin-like peptidase domain-containing protein [Candidatus Saccharimonadales bacterium]|nr:trypsin-like peptidase domain-containing protein [Candidatus Saccharimonadales bacterium]
METSGKPEKENNEAETRDTKDVPEIEPMTFTPGEPMRQAKAELESEEEAGTEPAPDKKQKSASPTPHHHIPGHRVRILAFVFLFMLSISSGFLGGWLFNHSKDGTDSTQTQKVVLKSQSQLISSIAKNVGQSVVSVEVTSTSSASSSYFGFGGSTGTEESAGTGIILTKSGLIITNRHVVPAGTQSVKVILSDGTTYDNVKVVGRTSASDSLDIAFLQITDTKGKTLSPASIGDSSKVNVGDSVVAIGNALGQFQNTVTSGIISGYGRSVEASSGSNSSDSESLDDLFQTDAAINEGNSGGPLVNLEGEVIGINTAVASSAQNIGFAIPINDVTGLIKSVEETGELKRPYLGVVYVSLTDDIAKQYSLSVSRGAYIPPSNVLGEETIVAGGPAAKAGVKEGDIITKVDGTAIDENTSLTSLLGKHSVGDNVQLTINRGGKTVTINVTLGNAPTS